MNIREIAINLSFTARQLLTYGRASRFFTDRDAARSYPALAKKGLVRWDPERGWIQTDLGQRVANITFSADVEYAIQLRGIATEVRRLQGRVRRLHLTAELRDSCQAELTILYDEINSLLLMMKNERDGVPRRIPGRR